LVPRHPLPSFALALFGGYCVIWRRPDRIAVAADHETDLYFGSAARRPWRTSRSAHRMPAFDPKRTIAERLFGHFHRPSQPLLCLILSLGRPNERAKVHHTSRRCGSDVAADHPICTGEVPSTSTRYCVGPSLPTSRSNSRPVRSGHQSHDREGTRPEDPAIADRHCRRVDRIGFFAGAALCPLMAQSGHCKN